MILALAPEGLSLTGAELASFEDLTVMVRDGEPFTPAVVFFPMHRIERVELDLPDSVAAEPKAQGLLDPKRLIQLVAREVELDRPHARSSRNGGANAGLSG